MRGDGELEFLLQSDIGRILAVSDLSAARVLPLPRQPHQFAQDHIGVQKNIHLKQGDVVAK